MCVRVWTWLARGVSPFGALMDQRIEDVMKTGIFAAILIILPILGMVGGHFYPDTGGLFMSLSLGIGIAVATTWFRSRKATRR